jgi:serine/threonine protein kinase
MTKFGWFEYLAGLPTEARIKELEVLQKTAPDLAKELIALLKYDADTRSEPFETGANVAQALNHALSARNDIPNYRLLSILGQGGMGEVWRAEREIAGNTQLIALKILKLGSENLDLHERFALEQRTLLKLNHPNIARLLDAGVATDGRPWIAMELVEGLAITQYCNVHRLSVPTRLRLFRQVIAAVQYAHDYFIVHRDIKPENVMVDLSGNVKLLDFGIAKSLDRHAPNTLTQQRFFSLYATAPEQLLGGTICVGTDVYALGGLLYELLSGAALMSKDIKTPTDLQRFIVDKTPVIPSKMTTDVAGTNAGDVSAAKLSSLLKGDLDRIVLHALRKLPSERYASAREFDEDIRAYLELRPVKATGQSAVYRAKKFLRRRWLAALVSALIIISTLTLTAMLGLRGNQLARANVVAQTEIHNAIDAKLEAESVNQFLMDVFKRADPLAHARGDKSLGVIIDASFAEIKARQKFNQANTPLLIALVQGLLSIGKPAQADELLLQIEGNIKLTEKQVVRCNLIGALIASAQKEKLTLAHRLGLLEEMTLDENQKNQLKSLKVQLAFLQDQYLEVIKLTETAGFDFTAVKARLESLLRVGRSEEAENLAESTLNIQATERVDRPFLLSIIASVSAKLNRRPESYLQFKQALAEAEEVFGLDSSNLLAYKNDVANALFNLGKYEAAELSYSKIVEEAKVYFKADDKRFSYLSLNIALCRAKRGARLDDTLISRLEKAGESISRGISAQVALVRYYYLTKNTGAMEKQLEKINTLFRQDQFTPELKTFIYLYKGKKKEADGIKPLLHLEFDPILADLLR